MSSVLEIVELVDGEVVLRRADSESEPLLRLQFSEEAQLYIGGAQVEVARAMIQAGIEAVSDVQLQEIEAAREKLDLERDAAPLHDTQNDIANDETAAQVDPQAMEATAENTSSEESQPRSGVSSATPKRELGSIKASDLSSRRVLH